MADSYGRKDSDGVMATFVESNPSIVGTGLDEIRFGRGEVLLQVARDMSEADLLSMSMDNVRVDVFGDSAFAFSDSKIHATFGEDTHEFPLRATFGLVRTDSGWRIAQHHVSVAHRGQDEGRSFSVKLTQTLADLLTSIDAAAGSTILGTQHLGTTTILFTDIVNSTQLSEAMGDLHWSNVISKHFEMVRAIVEAEHGSVVKTLGDGGMYAFPSATGALLAAIRIQQSMAGSETPALRLRTGAHTGDVIQGTSDYIGLTVNKAARVAAAADGGQVLVSQTTGDIADPSQIQLGEPKTVELKGISGTHVVFPLLWDE
jgi:class 3 adenylate cyclase/ketosteroid isomerase-like protein